MEGCVNPKDWACGRQKLKRSTRRDFAKSSANGATLRKARYYNQKAEQAVEVDDPFDERVKSKYGFNRGIATPYHAPNPIEKYFNKYNPNSTIISNDISNIIKETKPSEIIVRDRNKRDYITNYRNYGDLSNKSISLIYKYNKEEYNDALIWQLKHTSHLKKMENEFSYEKSINFLNNNYKNGKNSGNKGKKRKGNEYIPPIIDESSLKTMKTKIFYTDDSTHNNPKVDFILLDFGSNRWITAFSTTYHWGKDRQRDSDGKYREIWHLKKGVDNYLVELAYDENEFERNLAKFYSKTKFNSKNSNRVIKNGYNGYDSDDEIVNLRGKRLRKQERKKTKNSMKTTMNYSNKNGKTPKNSKNSKKYRKNNNNNNNKQERNKILSKNEEYIDKMGLNWERLGCYNGSLANYYYDTNREFSIEKTFRVGIDQSRQFNKNTFKNGRYARYIKITPLAHERNVVFTAYGLKIDLLGKPIVVREHHSKMNDFIDVRNAINGSNDNNGDSGVYNGNNNGDSNEEIEDYIMQTLRMGGESKLINDSKESKKSSNNRDGNDNSSHIVRVSFNDVGRRYEYGHLKRHILGDFGYYSDWAYEGRREFEQQERRYLESVRQAAKRSKRATDWM